MRLFIAVEVPEEAAVELRQLQSKLKTEGAALRFVKDFHLTLRFIGEAQPETAEKIKQALSNVSFSRVKARLGSTGCFPPSGMPRVVWVALEPAAAFKAMHDAIDTAIQPLLPKDERFESHVTLARVKAVINRKQFADKLNVLKPKPVEFTVSSFFLIKSTLAREGPVYEHLAEYKAL